MKPGRFHLSLAIAGAVCLSTAAGCYQFTSPMGVRLPDSSRFESEWKNYGRLQSSKAMCVAGDMSGIYVTGYSFGAATDHAAVEGAMTACEARRADKRIDAPCIPYAIGDTPVDRASNADSIFR